MTTKLRLILVLAIGAVAALTVLRYRTPPRQTIVVETAGPLPSDPPASAPVPPLAPPPLASAPLAATAAPPVQLEAPGSGTNRLARLAQLREQFRQLAAAPPAAALRAARDLTDPTERETALLTLVGEWTQGELSSPTQRAAAILRYGLDAGLGMELARHPELAVLWAQELTEGPGRFALLNATARALLLSDPAAAFDLGNRLPQEDQGRFSAALLETWALTDTEAALQWVNQLTDPIQRDFGLSNIREVAPVGIGAAIRVQEDGYPVIQNLLPEGPAARSSQLQPGDRILALGQGGGALVDTRGMPLETVVGLIRGAPGTSLQLQVESAGAPPGSPPRTVWITRDQVKFKQDTAPPINPP